MSLVVLIASATFYYRVAELERGSGIALAGASILVWMVTAGALGWGIFGCLIGQVGVFAALTARNAIRDIWRGQYRRPRETRERA